MENIICNLCNNNNSTYMTIAYGKYSNIFKETINIEGDIKKGAFTCIKCTCKFKKMNIFKNYDYVPISLDMIKK
jgi:hypothetical protein